MNFSGHWVNVLGTIGDDRQEQKMKFLKFRRERFSAPFLFLPSIFPVNVWLSRADFFPDRIERFCVGVLVERDESVGLFPGTPETFIGK